MRIAAIGLVLFLCGFGCKKNETTSNLNGTTTAGDPTAMVTSILTRDVCESPIVINVIGDGFESDDALTAAVKSSVAEALTVKPFSDFCFRIEIRRLPGARILTKADNGQQDCWYVKRAEAVTAVRDLKAIDVDKRSAVIVLMINDAIGGGCAEGHVFFIDTGTSAHAVKHELGHAIGGLRDEYTDKPSCTDCIAWRNCIRDRTMADWGQTAVEGCDDCRTGKFRPQQDCAMNQNTPDFCFVCSDWLRDSLARTEFGEQPSASATSCPVPPMQEVWQPDERTGRDVLVRISRSAVEVLSETASRPGDPVLPYVTGSGLIGVVERRKTFMNRTKEVVVGVAGVPDDVFMARSYSQNVEGHEIRVPTDSVVVAMTVWGESDEGPIGDLELKTVNLSTAPSRPVFDEHLVNLFLEKEPPTLNLGKAWNRFRTLTPAVR